jgi:hypothetical protein
MATENNREQSTVRLGDLYSVRGSEIQIQNSRDQRTVRESDNRERFVRHVVKKELNV